MTQLIDNKVSVLTTQSQHQITAGKMVAALIKLKPDLSNHALEMSQKEELATLLLKLSQTYKFAKSIVPVLIQSGNRKALDLL